MHSLGKECILPWNQETRIKIPTRFSVHSWLLVLGSMGEWFLCHSLLYHPGAFAKYQLGALKVPTWTSLFRWGITLRRVIPTATNYFVIVSDISSGSICGIYFLTFYSGILSGIYSDILSWHGHWPLELAVEVRQCPLSSGARSRDAEGEEGRRRKKKEEEGRKRKKKKKKKEEGRRRKKKEEEGRRRKKKEEEGRRRKEEEGRRRKKKEEEGRRRKEKEEEGRRRKEKEEGRRRKEKEGEGRRKEGEGRRRKEKEGEGRRRKEKEGRKQKVPLIKSRGPSPGRWGKKTSTVISLIRNIIIQAPVHIHISFRVSICLFVLFFVIQYFFHDNLSHFQFPSSWFSKRIYEN